MNQQHNLKVGLIGYGEVGSIFATALCRAGAAVSTYDSKFNDPVHGPQAVDACNPAPVRALRSMDELLPGMALVISAVTASSTLDVAEQAARDIAPGTLYLDVNSASPETKRRCAQLIGAAGGRYIETVMTSVPPYGAGSHATGETLAARATTPSAGARNERRCAAP